MVLQFSKKYRAESSAHQLLDKISNQVGIGAVTIKETYANVFKQRDRLLPDYIHNGDSTRGSPNNPHKDSLTKAASSWNYDPRYPFP